MKEIKNMQITHYAFGIIDFGLRLSLDLKGDGYGVGLEFGSLICKLDGKIDACPQEAINLWELFEFFEISDIKSLLGKYVRVEFEDNVAINLYGITDMTKVFHIKEDNFDLEEKD